MRIYIILLLILLYIYLNYKSPIEKYSITDDIIIPSNVLENELTTDLAEYVFYCEAIHELIKRYEVVQFRQEQIEAKKSKGPKKNEIFPGADLRGFLVLASIQQKD